MCLNFALKHQSDHLGERKLKKKCSDFNLLGLLFRHFVVKNTTFYWIKDFLLVFSKTDVGVSFTHKFLYTYIHILIQKKRASEVQTCRSKYKRWTFLKFQFLFFISKLIASNSCIVRNASDPMSISIVYYLFLDLIFDFQQSVYQLDLSSICSRPE